MVFILSRVVNLAKHDPVSSRPGGHQGDVPTGHGPGAVGPPVGSSPRYGRGQRDVGLIGGVRPETSIVAR